MSDFPKSATVIVIGGGVMGASTAYHLARRGCTDVVLLEKEEFFGTGATGRCAGGIRYQFSTEINIRLSLLSLPMLDRFEDELGQNIGIRRDGYLFILTNERDVEVFRHNVELQRSLGVQTQWLSGDDVRRRVPQLVADDVIAGAFHDKDGLADPNSVVMGYVNAAKRLGVRALTETGVSAITTTGRRQGRGCTDDTRADSLRSRRQRSRPVGGADLRHCRCGAADRAAAPADHDHHAHS